MEEGEERVVLGELEEVVVVVLLDAQPAAEGEAQVVEGAEPGLRLLLVEDELVAGPDEGRPDGGSVGELGVAQRTLGEPPELRGGLLVV